MHIPAADVLVVWERAQDQPPAVKALWLLRLVCPQRSFAELADLPIGSRDGLLLDVREHLFGPHLQAIAACPACSQKVELSCTVSELRAEPPAQEASPEESAPGAVYHRLCHGDTEVWFRLPTGGDLLAVVQHDAPAKAVEGLVERCVQARAGAGAFPGEAMEAVAQEMRRLDPQAEILFDIVCPACANAWQEAFDIVAYLWQEIEQQARRLLADVHRLASVYHWHERDILNLGPQRRQWYLQMIG